ncbi:Alanine--tRNA ligase [uncultured archaeon]|nr:Alanine--tRNA ligase [uncultured archaeon]
MISKDYFKQEFAKNPSTYYEVKVFKEQGFQRSTCSICGKNYWSLKPEEKDCGDSSHTSYSFFRDKPRRISYEDFWKKFSGFFKENGHAEVSRYPVLSRWRDDLYFTIASIVDFQRLEKGKIVFEYPKNPLIVPQMFLRFGDIPNVGVTGRHLSCFMMAGQHSFKNKLKPNEGYWKDECIKYNYEFLTKVLEVKKEELKYGEDVWAMPDFSAYGPCIESFSGGLEIVNSVLMQYYWDYEKSLQQELPVRVIDVGWGFERLMWFYSGHNNIYESIFYNQIDLMKENSGIEFESDVVKTYSKNCSVLDFESSHLSLKQEEEFSKLLGINFADYEKKIKPLQGVYAIADHSRALLLALSDGALPSNTGGGYNLRVILRRSLDFIKRNDFTFSLFDVMESHSEDLKNLFPETKENLNEIQEIIEFEEKKYKETLGKNEKLATTIIQNPAKITTPKLLEYYESNGLTPEVIENTALTLKEKVEIPGEFYKLLSERHGDKKRKPKKQSDLNLPNTKLIYYTDEKMFDASAQVLFIGNKKDEEKGITEETPFVVLDKTIFYPEGGGQMYDKGFIHDVKVINVQKEGDLVLHYLDKEPNFDVGSTVPLLVDDKRRNHIIKHHTATHLTIQSAKRLFGNHVWQTGSNKDEDIAHVDITHYQKLNKDQLIELEDLVNLKILEDLNVKAEEVDRGEAERKYGFRLYQGAGAISNILRIVSIYDENSIIYDVEACGGLHVKKTSEINLYKIVKQEQIQDGVLRLYYKAGEKALEYSRQLEELVDQAIVTLPGSSKEKLIPTIQKLVSESQNQRKELSELKESVALLEADKINLLSKEPVIVSRVFYDDFTALKISENLKKLGRDNVIISKTNSVFASTTKESTNNAVELVKQNEGTGGGSKEFAQGKIKV